MEEIEIKLVENGFVVKYCDPKIKMANGKKDAKWRDPMVARVYETQDAMMADLSKLVPKLVKAQKTQADEYESAFNQAESKDDD